MMTNDPIEAVMRALDTGIRTQAMANLEEVGCRVQTSASRGAGASHGSEYTPVWAYIRQCEEDRKDRAAVLYTLFALNDEESNAWVDAMHELVTSMLAENVPGWSKLTMLKRQRAEWLAFAAIIERRSDLERVMPAWGPERISFFLAEQHGVKIATNNWRRDYEPLWLSAHRCIAMAEDDALLPVSAIIKRHNSIYWNEISKAA